MIQFLFILVFVLFYSGYIEHFENYGVNKNVANILVELIKVRNVRVEISSVSVETSSVSRAIQKRRKSQILTMFL